MAARKVTRDEFVERAIAIHDDKYDYSDVVWVNRLTKVKIRCNECGNVFEQIPSNHLQGCGCPVCNNRMAHEARCLTTESYIKKAVAVHGDKYDYSKVDYKNSREKIKIICKTCGHEFQQSAGAHLQGAGCIVCARDRLRSSRRLAQEEVISRMCVVHGDKYDYSRVNYVNGQTRVEIICPIHGSFFQKPYDHLQGHGCPLCAQESVRAFRKHFVDERRSMYGKKFIEDAKRIHGDKYDYSKVKYVTNQTKVEIICPIHGLFYQTPAAHLHGGCIKCAQEKRWLSFEEFYTRAIAVWGDTYTYLENTYKNMTTKMSIVCPVHGVFEQLPTRHVAGNGCPKCKIARREETCLRLYGVRAYVQTDECKVKSYVTREKNGTFGLSQTEVDMVSRLCGIFGEDDVEPQYCRDERYPYHVDVYIKSRDMFIELNAYWTHGNHWFNVDDALDVVTANVWLDRMTERSQYVGALVTWMYSDVEKRETARKNNLNYVVFWDNDLKDFETWVDAGCPDSHDWEREYAWRFGPEALKADTGRGEAEPRPERVQPAPDVA